MKYFKTTGFLFILLLFVFSCLSGCVAPQKASQKEAVCKLPSSKIVLIAFDEARANLSRSECISQFDDTFEALLVASAGDPKIENKRLFHDFLKWSMNEGIIRKTDASRLYTEYFSYKYASLPNDYNVCSYGSKEGQIGADLRKELVKKERGLMQVSKDNENYLIAHNNQAKLALILEATWRACSNGNDF